MSTEYISDVNTGETSTVPYVPSPVEETPLPVSAVSPFIFGTVAVTIENGAVSTLELAANLNGVLYEPGWLQIYFNEIQDERSYIVFVQTDKPARVEQFKSGGSFELVFTDPVTNDPVNLAQIDLQILKVR